jgi:hypothetical protein
MPLIDLLSRWSPARRAARAAAAAGLVVLAAAGLTGCYTRASAAPAIELSTAVVPQPSVPGKTVAFLVIRNNGNADRLISAHTSAGGPSAPRATRSRIPSRRSASQATT